MPYGAKEPILKTAFYVMNFFDDEMISAANLADKANSCYIEKLINTEIQILKYGIKTCLFFIGRFL